MPSHPFFTPALLAFAASAIPLNAQLLLTEINSNGTGGDFWELTNVGTSAVDLSNYKWNDSARNTGATAVTIPSGTSIAAGESIVFNVTGAAAAFRTAWGIPNTVQVISGGPGLGQDDAVTLFNASGAEVFYLTYALNGYTRSSGSGSAGGHAGASAGGSASVSMVWDPAFGTSSPRYAAASAGSIGCFAYPTASATIGSPGYSGFTTGGGPTVTLSITSAPSSFAESAVNPAATGTISRAVATAADLMVNLSSSDLTEATVPATVTILANQTSATFPINAVDDSFPDGAKSVTLSATATDANSPTFNITVTDDGDVLDNSFMLTEIQSSQSTGKPTGADDYWELTNISAITKDISGYSWHDSGRSGASAAAYKLPNGTTLAAAETVVFTAMAPAAFRAWWGIPNTVQVFQSVGAPGLGKGDGISFFDAGQNELFFFSYAGGGFLLENGSPSTAVSEHAGVAGGGTADSQALVWVPSSGTVSPRYTAATGSNYGSFSAVSPATDLGSPGKTAGSATVSIGNASAAEGNSLTTTLPLLVTRTDTATAFTVAYAVTGGTAAPGTDYATLASGTLNFTAGGAASLPINITVNGDTDPENDETVIVTLSNVLNTIGTTGIGAAAGTATILNDDASAPQITTQPASVTITSGTYTTLNLVATGSPSPTVQWYQGASGITTTPVGTNSTSFTTPALTATTSYWARVSNIAGVLDSSTAIVNIGTTPTSVNLANYVRIGRYNLPEPTRTALPPGTASHNLLCQEASGVAYNWDTGTLFICGDGGRSLTQVSKTGVLIDTMSLELNAPKPQGVEFYDPEGITYIGGGEFVFSEERDRQLVKFTYAAGTTLLRSNTQTVDLGTFSPNEGTEGLSYDPQTNSAPNLGFICLKEINPQGLFQTGVDFNALTATNGSSTTANSTDLFDPALAGMADFADVFALSNLPYLNSQPQSGNLLVLSQASARIVNISRTGSIASSLQIVADPGSPLSAADQQHEGLTMDRDGILYVVNENGGGSIDYPQLWVYAPSAVPNQAPTAVALDNAVTAIVENTSTAAPIKVADIAVTDDGLGTNTLTVTGTDAAFFEIAGSSLYLKVATLLDYETKTSYAVTVNADDTTLGGTPDATVNFILSVTDVVNETPELPNVFISEVHPSGSGNPNGYGVDWFEVTNAGTTAVTVSGWQMDDNSDGSAKVALRGVTSIPAGKSAVFFEGDATGSTDATLRANFSTAWFGSPTPPAGVLIGAYGGGGVGLGTGGDSVNLFDAANARLTGVRFGASTTGKTFDNHAAIGGTTLPLPLISTLSVVGIHGAYLSNATPAENGSPGTTGKLLITEVAPWASAGSPVAADWFELTNTGATAVDLTGWKMDDVSESPVAAVALNGITSIAPGESVIFVETATPGTTIPAFLNNWFGSNAPAGIQIGSYSGSGVGLEPDSDAVNIYDSNGVRHSAVSFGASPAGPSFPTFDNTAGVNFAAISTLSVVGINHAFAAVNSASEIGSPGPLFTPPPVAGSFAAWLAANGYTSTGIDTDTDGDGIRDSVEYFFNLNPNHGGGFGNLPQLFPNGGAMELDFTRLTTAVDVAGTLKVSGDLATWISALPGLDYTVASSVVTGDETAFTYALPGTGPSAPGVSSVYLLKNNSDPVGASLGGIRVVNEGLVGVGRLSGESLDKFGETQGAASGLFITGWAWNGSHFTGRFNVLPDRGHGDGTSNYAARLHEVDFSFAPYYGTTAVAQNQVSLSYVDSTKFTYQDGAKVKFTTGLNPTGTSTLFSQTVGTITAANGPGGAQESLLSFDAEAVHLFDDGSGFVSDEYGTYIARFDASKKITGLTQLPGAAQPFRPAGTPNFDSVTAPVTGRRNNQGLEGMSVTPDGTRLFALLQSATVQDSGSTAEKRNNARLFVYDIVGANRENPVPVGEYVVKLPQIDLNSDGSGADGTAAQSEIVALGGSSFLMLPRDGNGLGKGSLIPILFKSVQLVDFASATNILGQADGAGQSISPQGVLPPEIKAAATAEVINILQSDDLDKFGLNTTNPANSNTLNEKIEGMALVPDLSTPQANDFFLFVANDNDFESSDVRMLNAAGIVASKGDGRLNKDINNIGITNDAMFYVWRLTIDAGGKKFFRFEVK